MDSLVKVFLSVFFFGTLSCNPPMENPEGHYEAHYLTVSAHELNNSIAAKSIRNTIRIAVRGSNGIITRDQILASARAWHEVLRGISSNVTTNFEIVDNEFNVDLVVHLSNRPDRAYAQLYQSPVRLFLFQGDAYPTLLHEMGHAYGLGDTYVEGSNPLRCRNDHPYSVMCMGTYSRLMPDDIEGLGDIFCHLHPGECPDTVPGDNPIVNPPPGGGGGGGCQSVRINQNVWALSVPNPTGQRLFSLRAGAVVQVLEVGHGGYRISSGQGTGWIRQNMASCL